MSGILTAEQGIAILRSGGVVAIPTETVYGLAARSDLTHAVAQVFAAKKRPFFDPLIVHIADPADVWRLVTDIPEPARLLAEKFWPGPLTLVLPKRPEVPDLVTAGLPTVAVRCPQHTLARYIIREVGYPLAAPSANLFGRLSPTSAEAVLDQMAQRIDGVVDGGTCSVGLESTIIAFIGETAILLRPGGLSLESIEAVIGPVKRWGEDGRKRGEGVPAPGVLPKHYSPRTKMLYVEQSDQIPQDLEWRSKAALVVWNSDAVLPGFARVETLTNGQDSIEAAARFYNVLRVLDDGQYEYIVAVAVPERGLGLAINDRLYRAAGSEVYMSHLKP